MEKEVEEEDEEEDDEGGVRAGERRTFYPPVLVLFPFLISPFLPSSLVPLSLHASVYISGLFLLPRPSPASSMLVVVVPFSLFLSLSLPLPLSLSLFLCFSLSLLVAIASHPLPPLVFPLADPLYPSRSRLQVFLCRSRAFSLVSLVPPFPRLSGFLPGLFLLLLPAASHPTLFKPRRPLPRPPPHATLLSALARLPRPSSRYRP